MANTIVIKQFWILHRGNAVAGVFHSVSLHSPETYTKCLRGKVVFSLAS